MGVSYVLATEYWFQHVVVLCLPSVTLLRLGAQLTL